jgi:hypothetical protein
MVTLDDSNTPPYILSLSGGESGDGLLLGAPADSTSIEEESKSQKRFESEIWRSEIRVAETNYSCLQSDFASGVTNSPSCRNRAPNLREEYLLQISMDCPES